MNNTVRIFIAIMAALTLNLPAVAGTMLDSLQDEITAIVSRSVPAVVNVKTEPLPVDWGGIFGDRNAPAWFKSFLDSNFAARKKSSSGSGFIIDPEGYVLTTAHVIKGSSQVEVTLADGRVLAARVVGSNRKINLALLKIEGKKFPYLKLGRSRDIKVGSWAIAIGNPFGLTTSPSWGIISGRNRSGLGIAPYENMLQITAPINPGDSGGPLLNARGEVIGILAATLSGYREFKFDLPFMRRFHEAFPSADWFDNDSCFQPSLAQGIGFAIPVDLAREVIPLLKKSSPLPHGWLGVQIEELPFMHARKLNLKQGVLITAVIPASPAGKAGLKKGDIVLTVNRRSLTCPPDLEKAVLFCPVGEEMELEIFRRGSRIIVHVTIASCPTSSPPPEKRNVFPAR